MARVPQMYGSPWKTGRAPPPGSVVKTLYCMAPLTRLPSSKKPQPMQYGMPCWPQVVMLVPPAVLEAARSLTLKLKSGPPAAAMCLTARLIPLRLAWPYGAWEVLSRSPAANGNFMPAPECGPPPPNAFLMNEIKSGWKSAASFGLGMLPAFVAEPQPARPTAAVPAAANRMKSLRPTIRSGPRPRLRSWREDMWILPWSLSRDSAARSIGVASDRAEPKAVRRRQCGKGLTILEARSK